MVEPPSYWTPRPDNYTKTKGLGFSLSSLVVVRMTRLSIHKNVFATSQQNSKTDAQNDPNIMETNVYLYFKDPWFLSGLTVSFYIHLMQSQGGVRVNIVYFKEYASVSIK